jgi:competence protein ComEC
MLTQNNLFSHINLQTAPVFLLMVLALSSFAIAYIVSIPSIYGIIISIALLVFTIILTFARFNTAAFILLGISFGIGLFVNANNGITFTRNAYHYQDGYVSGKVVRNISTNDSISRFVIDGWINTESLPLISNTSILVAVKHLQVRSKIEVGDSILARCRVRPPNAKNPANNFNERQWLAGFNANWIANAQNVQITHRATGIEHIRNVAFNSLPNKVDTIFTPATAAFVKALILGDRDDLTKEQKSKFSIAGVSHILSLSGLHIGIISAILLVLLQMLRVNRWSKFVIFTILVVAFIFLTGMLPSAMRAGAMAILFMLGNNMQRKVNFLNVIGMVLLASMCIKPSLLYSISFQMSMLAITGIYIFYQVFRSSFIRLTRTNNRISIYLINSISLTLSASIIINPLVAYYFGTFSIVSPLSNAIVVPLFSAGLCFALVAIIGAFIYLPLGILLAGSVEIVIKLCVEIVDIAASFEYSSIIGGNVILIAIVTSLVIGYLATSQHWKQLASRSIISIVCCTLLFVIFA